MKNKKILAPLMVLFSLGFTMLALNGCSSSNQTQKNIQNGIDSLPQDRRMGYIESLGGVHTSSRGTHLLRLDDGNTILLRSLPINLDEEKYKNVKVEVRGILNYTTEKTQIMDVDTIDILDQAPTEEIKHVSIQDYTNDSLGFSAKYRDDFEVKESVGKVVFSRAVKLDPFQTITQQKANETIPVHRFSVTLTPNNDDKPLFGILKLENDQPQTLTAAGYSTSKIGSSGINAYKKTDGKSVTYYFLTTEKFWILNYAGGNDDQNVEDMNVFYNFVNSFQVFPMGGPTQEKK